MNRSWKITFETSLDDSQRESAARRYVELVKGDSPILVAHQLWMNTEMK